MAGTLRSGASPPGCQPQSMLPARAAPVRARGRPPRRAAAHRPTMQRPGRVRGSAWPPAAAGSHGAPCLHWLRCSHHLPWRRGAGTRKSLFQSPFHLQSRGNRECLRAGAEGAGSERAQRPHWVGTERGGCLPEGKQLRQAGGSLWGFSGRTRGRRAGRKPSACVRT